VEAFLTDAAGRLPAVVYSFNIADFKRRNGHLGHVAGDADIVALERMLAGLGSQVLVARVCGQRWLVLAPAAAHGDLESICARFARSDPILVGWELLATKDRGSRFVRETQPSTIHRALRCLCAPVDAPAALALAVARIDEDDYALPVSRPIAIDDVPTLGHTPWRCVQHDPKRPPSCPFCAGRGVAWQEGDSTGNGGEGTCEGCGATLVSHDVSELLPIECHSGDSAVALPRETAFEQNATLEDLGFRRIVPVAHYRIAIAEYEGNRVLVSVLRRPLPRDQALLAGRPPWDLPLLAVRPAWSTEDAPSVLVELLPRGFPSTWAEPRASTPPFVVTVAERFAAAHAAGRVVGAIHPALVFVDYAGELVGVAQRPLRAEYRKETSSAQGSTTSCGMAPMFFDPVLSCKQLRGDPSPDDAPDDVFRLAVVIWRWRHRQSPFGTTEMARLQNAMTGTLASAPKDHLDRLLARALSREPLDRPTVVEILSALRGIGAGWATPPDNTCAPPTAEDPRIGRARADAVAMIRFLTERRAAAECVKALLRVETTIDTDASEETVVRDAEVFATRTDGTGDSYRFSGAPEALSASFDRRIRSSRSAPDPRELAVLHDEMLEVKRARDAGEADPTLVGDKQEIVAQIVADLGALVARAPRPDALRTSVRASHRVRWRLFSDLDSQVEHTDVALFVTIEHRVEAANVPSRLYGETLSAADLEDGAGARRAFRHVPTPEELDALVAEARVAKPW
jgi:GGDEF domain-containing protein